MTLVRRINVCLGMVGLLAAAVSPVLGQWEFLTNVHGSRYTYDLTTTPRAVYMTLGDTLGNCMGLYRFDRLTAETEFVGKPDDPIYGVHVAGANDEHIWLGSQGHPGHEDYLWHSSDAGETWEVQRSAAHGEHFAVGGTAIGEWTYIGSHNFLCLESSTDYGQTWITWGGCSSEYFYGARAIESDLFNEKRAYAAIVDWSIGALIVVETADGGETWEDVYIRYNMPAFGCVYPSPFHEGDVSVVDGGGVVLTRIDGQWINQG
ncbi:MAG: hypothetical protein GF355_06100, partial [Candidatus Eisenbacteria bacterium]|nr:hypothetical protein [Candidatus Eisenbacteria bacterium]